MDTLISLGRSFILLSLTLFLSNSIYNLYFHPLRKYPGPWYTRASRFPYIYYQLVGRLPHAEKRWHDRYGQTIRIAPNDLSFLQSQAWFDIHGHQTPSRPGWFERDASIYPVMPDRPSSILLSNEADHTRYRRCLSHSFSEKALRDQEPVIQSHIDSLISKLHKKIDGPEKGRLNVNDWAHYVTFDIIGDLALGKPFGCLENEVVHPWVAIMFASIQNVVYFAVLTHLPKVVFESLVSFIVPRLGDMKKDIEYASKEIAARLSRGSERGDFMSPILKIGLDTELGMSISEIEASFDILMIAGAETTATLLSATLYYLAMYPEANKALLDELYTAFPSRSSKDVTRVSVQNLPYLFAVIEESLRLYPPLAHNLARIIPHGGAMICGERIPAGTSVAVSTYAAFLSETNWTDPEEFKPERWIGEQWKGDDRRVLQPFSTGPRTCLGKNLAYLEMKLILARLLLEFRFEMDENNRNWKDNQRIFLMRERPALMFRVSRANPVAP